MTEHDMNSKFEHLETKFWTETILCHPELEDKCPWNQFGPADWHDILMEHPEFISHAPKRITLTFMSANQWLEVLIAHPELDAYVPTAKSLFKKDSQAIGKLWGTLLSRHPKFAKYEPWKRLRSSDWKKVLSQQPQFIVNYERECSNENTRHFSLTINDQACIIACQPSLFSHFKSDDFHGEAWETILCNQPQFRDRCDLDKIGPHRLGRLLKRHPEWLNYCDTYSMTPKEILYVAESFPEVLNHCDLDNFKEIGGGDTPWIEKYPCLVPSTRWNFSYTYWDALLTRLSVWQKNGKYLRVDPFAMEFVKSLKTENFLTKHSSSRKYIARPLPDNPKETNLRNSIDSIMEYRYWIGLDDSVELMETIPLRIRKILVDKNLTYEQLMIKMGMMSQEDCGKVLFGLFINDPNEFLNTMLGDDLKLIVQQVPVNVLLPLAIMYASSSCLYSVLVEIVSEHGYDAVTDFRDKAGNNAWHYFFFRNPLYHPSRKTLQDALEYGNYKFLADYACAPDTPNNMGFSYNQINQAMKKYLKIEE